MQPRLIIYIKLKYLVSLSGRTVMSYLSNPNASGISIAGSAEVLRILIDREFVTEADLRNKDPLTGLTPLQAACALPKEVATANTQKEGGRRSLIGLLFHR